MTQMGPDSVHTFLLQQTLTSVYVGQALCELLGFTDQDRHRPSPHRAASLAGGNIKQEITVS